MTLETESTDLLLATERQIEALEQARKEKMELVVAELSNVTGLIYANIALPVPGHFKDAGQISMDIIRAAELHSQVHYDIQIVRAETREETDKGYRKLFDFKLHTFVPGMELQEGKRGSLTGEGEATFNERMTQKRREKAEELFDSRRDLKHLIFKSDNEKYRAGPKGAFKEAVEPIDILNEIMTQPYHKTHWGDALLSLRAVALDERSRDILGELIPLLEEE